MKGKSLFYGLLMCLWMAPASVCGQESVVSLFQRTFSEGTKKDFKGQYLKGARNGMGGVKKEAEVYVGDFVKNKRQGMGMQIVSEAGQIENCPGATVYVGRWSDDKKEGSGRCYAASGQLIYDGKFVDDAPVDVYPQETDSLQTFLPRKDEAGNLLVCEAFGGFPEGFGSIIFTNGDLWQSRFKDGAPQGIGLYISLDGEWETVRYGSDGTLSVLSSSQEYSALDSSRKAFINSSLSEALDCFTQAASSAAETVSMAKEIGNGSASGMASDAAASGGASSSSNVGGGNYAAMYANWERRAKQNYESLTTTGFRVVDDKTKKNVGGSTSQGMSGGNYTLQKKSLREAQREMKRIRTKAEKAGIKIPKSEYEDVVVVY